MANVPTSLGQFVFDTQKSFFQCFCYINQLSAEGVTGDVVEALEGEVEYLSGSLAGRIKFTVLRKMLSELLQEIIPRLDFEDESDAAIASDLESICMTLEAESCRPDRNAVVTGE